GQQAVVLIQSGIGKVNAALSTTLLLEHYPVKAIINIGTAGGLKLDAQVLDLVVSKQIAHHDVDATAFDYAYGQVPQMPVYYTSDNYLIDLLTPILNQHHIPYHLGTIVSGDSFIYKEEQQKRILEWFPDAIAVEMEAAA